MNSGWVFGGQWDPPQGAVGDCYTLTYGGVNGNPNDNGAYVALSSTAYRLNGNEVYMNSYSSVSGPNAGLIITHVKTHAYRNGTLIATNSSDSSSYGATTFAYTYQSLYFNGTYYLGAFQLGSPALQNDHWGTAPACESAGYYPVYVHYYDYSNTYVAQKPTITGPYDSTSAAIWYLGGAPSIDGYYTQVPLYGNTNWGGSLHWSVIQRSDKVSLSSSIANQNLATSTGANKSQNDGLYDYDVLAQADTDGLPTDPFPISVNAPWSVYSSYLGTVQYISDSGPQQGYQSAYNYLLFDVANNRMSTPITLHETLENCLANPPFDQPGNQTTWCGLVVKATWFPSSSFPPGWDKPVAGSWNGDASWTDFYWAAGMALYPAPQTPPAPPTPLGVTAVTNNTQKFFIGALGDSNTNPSLQPNIFAGMCVQRNKIQSYEDHGERQNVTSPVSVGTISGVPAACASGVFVNP
jgi:hypothetical protein